MSVRLTNNLIYSGFYPAKRESEEVPPERGGTSFQETLSAAAGKGTGGENVSPGAREAEFLHLAMMRNALSLDGSPAPSTVPAGRLEALLSAYAAGDLQKPSLSKYTVSTELQGIPGPTALPKTAIPAVSGNSNDPSISDVISRASRRYGVEESLIKAVIQVESNFKSKAVSPAGAQGLMQLMPATAAGLGVTDSFNPEQNIMAGTRFLKDLLNRYGGDLDKALAAYNWGPGNVDRGKKQLPQETREYLVRVKKLYETYSVA
jgi:soluble lytic murein transglycosylase-like protein